MIENIETKRLKLPLMTEVFLRLCLENEKTQAEALSGIQIHDAWLRSKSFMKLRMDQCRNIPEYRPWCVRAMVLRADSRMIGHIGFHTAPGPEYLKKFIRNGVEFGYTVFEEFRGQGYASEAIAGLMNWAVVEKGVYNFVVSISPDNTPSQALAKKFGFLKVGEQIDPEDGLEEIFVLRTKV